MEKSNITGEYIDLTIEYQQKYGPNTLVLLQVGAFFEVYGLKDKETGVISASNIEDFSQICQLVVTEKGITYKNKDVVMSGFRDYSLEKYLQKITDNNYTAVVYVQEKEGKNVKRVFYGVFSAGTYISFDTDSSPQLTNNIMCVWMDTFKPMERGSQSKTRETIIYGVATANIFTGKSSIFEYQTPFYMNPTTFDELERYISVYSPSEILFLTPFDEKTNQTILQYIGVKSPTIHYANINDVKNEKVVNCTKQKYIQHILSSFFGEDTYNVCTEFQTHHIATQSFCFLLNFIQEHNPNLVRNIAIPEFNNTSDRMILANHTLKQLNIIDDMNNDGKRSGQLSSVASFLNKCSCSMGHRLFESQLLNPTTNTKWLQTEYSMISTMLQEKNVHFVDIFKKELTHIKDMEKICRQLVLKRLYPSSIYQLYQSIQNIHQINTCLYENIEITSYLCNGLDNGKVDPHQYIDKMSSDFGEFINTHFVIDRCKNINSMNIFDENIIQRGVSVKLDGAIAEYEKKSVLFEEVKKQLMKLMNENGYKNDIEYIKIHETDKSGSALHITKARSEFLKKVLKNILATNPTASIQINDLVVLLREIKFSAATSTNLEIEIPGLSKVNKEILQLKDTMNSLMSETYLYVLSIIEEKWFVAIETLAKYIARLDVLICKTYISKLYNYCKPEIDESSHTKSYVDAYELRHCLIEHLQQNEIYVSNDVSIGGDNDGILLYGTNAVGKTSIIRALGISIIMAQSGMYVPCSRFIYKPYHSIYTRILGNDNIFKGLSTFAVEMSELRIILKMANEKSLILGDELCSGTETESALSIFVAGLMDLHEKRASFVFATHFHEIIGYDEIKQLDRLALKHMSVIYDREQDCLIYDRKLKDGAGTRTYGLEVCKSLYLPQDFLDKAYLIRNKYYPDTKGELSQHSTRYNAAKIKGVCEFCKENVGEEIHHLQHQKDADENGFIDTFHKNHKANLLTVCEKCHQKFHDDTDKPEQTHKTTKIPKERKKTTKGYTLV
jgi:DNA mismatch repair protein MutS